jgi:hypothetical protein
MSDGRQLYQVSGIRNQVSDQPAAALPPIRYQESGDRNQINYRRLRRQKKSFETPIGFHLSPVS